MSTRRAGSRNRRKIPLYYDCVIAARESGYQPKIKCLEVSQSALAGQVTAAIGVLLVDQPAPPAAGPTTSTSGLLYFLSSE